MRLPLDPMAIHDVTVAVNEAMPVAPGNARVRFERRRRTPDGLPVVVHMALSPHTGTHLDLPKGGLDAVPLDVLMGPATVVDATGCDRDLGPDLPLPDGIDERLLFRTRNSLRGLMARDGAFVADFVALTPALARRLVGSGVRLIGYDYLAVGGAETHAAFLDAGVPILEGLDLSAVAPGRYRLVCLPLKVVGTDGAPARAVLES